MRGRTWFVVALFATSLVLAACGAPPAPTATPIPPTATPVPPTATPVPPTATPVPPTATVAAAPAAKTGESIGPAVKTGTGAAKPGGGMAMGMGAMGVLSGLKSSGPAPAPTTDLAKQTKQALTKITSFRVTGTLTTQDTGPLKIKLEYVAPQSLNLVVNIDPAVVAKTPELNGQTEVAAMLIKDTLYLKFGPEWTKIEGEPSKPGASGESDLANGMVQALNEAKATKTGTETINGEPCDVYEMTEDGTTVKIWLSQKDQFVRQVSGKGPDVEFQFVVTDINAPISIKAPI